MPGTTTATTELASQYIAQVSSDLEANVKEQERITAEITSLQQQLASLQHDHGVLVSMQQALGITQATTVPATESTGTTGATGAAVPSPRRKKAGTAAGGKQKARTSSAAPAKSAAKQPAAKKTAAKKTAAAKAAEPTLVELIRRHLAEQKEPRSAAEIAGSLGRAHPERDISAKVVRVTLEGLVAKSQAERSKQGRSVFYSAPADKAAATPETEAGPDSTDD
jgi:predicted transcriptional regulator